MGLFSNLIFLIFSIWNFLFLCDLLPGDRLRRKLVRRTLDSFEQAFLMGFINPSKYMKHEGGYVLVYVKVDEKNELLIYPFLVSGQLNMIRFLVHVQHGINTSECIYGRGHVSSECKSHQMYADFKAISEL